MIVKYKDSYYGAWQKGVKQHGELCHDIRWREIIGNTYGLKPEYYVNIENGKITGGFPAFKVKAKLISLPFLSFSGPWGNFSIRELQTQIKKVILTKNLSNNQLDISKDDYITMRLEIPDSEEELWKLIGPKTRNLVRKACRTKFKLVTSTIDNFYSVYCKATNALGTPPHRKKFFHLIANYFNEISYIKIMYIEKNAVSCIFEIDYKSVRYDLWAFSLKEYFPLSPNMFLYYAVLKSALNSGNKIYDFGRSTYGQGTFFFKKQWGAKPYKLLYLTYSDKGVKENIAKKTLITNLFPKIWSKTPSIITNNIGPYLRKYIT